MKTQNSDTGKTALGAGDKSEQKTRNSDVRTPAKTHVDPEQVTEKLSTDIKQKITKNTANDDIIEIWKQDFRKENYDTYEITDNNAARQFDFIDGDEELDAYKNLKAECDARIEAKTRRDWHIIPGITKTINNVKIPINRYLCDDFHLVSFEPLP